MKQHKTLLPMTMTLALMLGGVPATAEVTHNQGKSKQITTVSQDPWQPDGFVNGTPVPAVWIPAPVITIDGVDDESAWSLASEIELPLKLGSVERAWMKAVYTDTEVFIRLRWADATENREHHPWTWDPQAEGYLPGPQVEDSVLLSFEAGCEWTPSLLGGYIYDFDGWQWLAARSDPLGQALDLYGNVQDRDTRLPEFYPYQSRVEQDDWILKFIENHDVDQHADWDELKRVYMLQPITRDLWVRAVPDGGPLSPAFAEQLPAPDAAPADTSQTFPQYRPVKLSGDAAQVAARGQWKDGYWTVEFRRDRETPVGHIYDTVFNRLVQFSVHVFDSVEQLDQTSESGRLFLQFLPPEQALSQN